MRTLKHDECPKWAMHESTEPGTPPYMTGGVFGQRLKERGWSRDDSVSTTSVIIGDVKHVFHHFSFHKYQYIWNFLTHNHYPEDM